ncbi:MAG: ribosomal protein S18-alanine N-acetyltransferase [Desulfofustis sp.]|nr:ribosomal protein S18-alanine N-acetyltransferase [Desulfofustis sp.]
MSDRIELAPLAAEHLSSIALLERQELSPWSERQIGAELTATNQVGLVAIDQGAVIGWCCCRFCEAEGELLKITVGRPHRRRRIGTLLLAAMEKRLSGSGVTTLLLEVRAANGSGVAFYRRGGFQLVGCRPRYYHDPEDDALLMSKVIGQERGMI